MEKTLEPGLEHEVEILVTEDLVPPHMRSAGVGVFATPEMVRLIERTALEGVLPYLAPGQQTVGTRVELSHTAATPVGMRVRARVRLVEVDRRRLKFQVEVHDEVEKVGEATHERFIVDLDKSQARVREKVARWRGGGAPGERA